MVLYCATIFYLLCTLQNILQHIGVLVVEYHIALCFIISYPVICSSFLFQYLLGCFTFIQHTSLPFHFIVYYYEISFQNQYQYNIYIIMCCILQYLLLYHKSTKDKLWHIYCLKFHAFERCHYICYGEICHYIFKGLLCLLPLIEEKIFLYRKIFCYLKRCEALLNHIVLEIQYINHLYVILKRLYCICIQKLFQ